MITGRLAHYEITGHLGSGGMGEVYQATDSKLGRSVAIKVLPEAFVNDPERAARFEREARVLASLNHPHIAAIYGLEESGQRKFLVMELAGGETLAERIARGVIPLPEILSIARQIAEALEAAHETGVIHRDLKPANIKITPAGQVKVLDFGLAKAFAGEAVDMNLSNSPTITMAATNVGVILGTAAYMSPEQARGIAIDARSDIFAFGAVLYEMLARRQAFSGETVSDILASVLKTEPDWSRLPAETPPAIRRLLRRCLEKDRKRRTQTAIDLQIAIDEALAEPEQSGVLSAVTKTKNPRSSWILTAVLLAVVLALAIPAVIHFREIPVPNASEFRLDIVTPPRTDPLSFAISPDGERLVYVAPGPSNEPLRLWLRPLNSTAAEPIAGTEGAQYPFWSPNSQSVGFFANTKLRRIDLGGGLPRTLADAGAGRGGSWNQEGMILFAPNPGTPLFRIPADGGEAVPVTKLDPTQSSHRFPRFLPDGRRFLFVAQGPSQTQGIYIGSLDSPEIKLLTLAETAGDYVAPGWVLHVRQGTLLAQRLDLERNELVGDALTVAEPVMFETNVLLGALSVSSTGVISYRSGSGANPRQLIWFDRSGSTLGQLGEVGNTLQATELAPNGLRVATWGSVQNNQDVWILDADRATPLTFDTSIDRLPIWSPDGRQVVFSSVRAGTTGLYRKQVDGGGSEELLLETSLVKTPTDWSPDGRFISYHSVDPETERDIWMLPLDGDRKPRIFLKTRFSERYGQFSPDGRWLAYQSNESGRNEIYVRSFPGPGGQWQVSTSGGIQPRWSPDGREVFYIAPDGKLMATPTVVNGDTIQAGTPTALFQTRIFGGGIDQNNGTQYDVAPNGRFLINSIPEDATATPITVLLNWKPPL